MLNAHSTTDKLLPSNASSPALYAPIQDVDPEIATLIGLEETRQRSTLVLIASENITSRAVLQANGSILTNKYAEGYPGSRYYSGNEYIDQVETICCQRALRLFRLDPEVWGVNVQPYSGSPANFEVYNALLEPHDRIMGLDLPSGGHLTHGYRAKKKKISCSSIYFESIPYHAGPDGLIDYDWMEKAAATYHPKLIICGGSAYPREWDYARFRKAADAAGAILMADMAHISGLVAGDVVENPFSYADIVTTTTHKTLRGPRGAMIFYRKTTRDGNPTDYEAKINFSVFPGCQGGPHQHTIAAIAVALKQADTPEFAEYTRQLLRNMQVLMAELSKRNYTMVTGGTDCHLLLWNLAPQQLNGFKMDAICRAAGVSLNKNMIPSDTSAINPSGVRIGLASMTSRGATEAHVVTICEFLHRIVQAAQEIIGSEKAMKNADFVTKVEVSHTVAELKREIEAFCLSFDLPTQ